MRRKTRRKWVGAAASSLLLLHMVRANGGREDSYTWGPSGSHYLSYGRARYIMFVAPNEFDEEDKIVRRNI